MGKIEINGGEVFGRWTIISEAEKVNGRRYFLCECSCLDKTRRTVEFSSLKSGGSTSCGCFIREKTIKRNTKHGFSIRGKSNHLYGVWKAMKRRCYSKNDKDYKNYGGRGIKVCDEWLHDFQSFYDWCNENDYNDNLEIDRENNDGNYEPSNCRFVTRQINNINQRIRKDNIVGYRGVGKDKRSVKWFFYINYNLVQYREYGFKEAIDAAIARDAYIIKNNLPHHLNFEKTKIGETI